MNICTKWKTKVSLLLMLVNILDEKCLNKFIWSKESLMSEDNCIETIYTSTVDFLYYRILRG